MTDADVTLAQGESLVIEPEELVFRQIVEWMVPSGVILTHVFGPSTSDKGMPSYSRSSIVTAQVARDWHNRYAPSTSTGVWAVSVDEVHEAERFVIDDSATPVPAGEKRAPGHCFVDFRDLTKADIKSIRFMLHQCAMARGEIPTEIERPDGQLAIDSSAG